MNIYRKRARGEVSSRRDAAICCGVKIRQTNAVVPVIDFFRNRSEWVKAELRSAAVQARTVSIAASALGRAVGYERSLIGAARITGFSSDRAAAKDRVRNNFPIYPASGGRATALLLAYVVWLHRASEIAPLVPFGYVSHPTRLV